MSEFEFVNEKESNELEQSKSQGVDILDMNDETIQFMYTTLFILPCHC